MKTKILLIILALLTAFHIKKIEQVNAQFVPQCYYNACSAGPLCQLGCQFYSPGDYIIDSYMEFFTSELKYVPHPYWQEFRDFTCRMDECTSTAATEYWYCASEIDGETPAVRYCDQFQTCAESDIDAGSEYCNLDAVRWSNGSLYTQSGWYTCTRSGWVNGGSGASGCCWSTPEPICRCTGGSFDSLNSGSWDCEDCYIESFQGRCEDMLDSYTIGFSPGSVITRTPYLFNIWGNVLAKTQSIFSLFRTVYKTPKDWPGDTNLTYSFTPEQGEGWADAGTPDNMTPGYNARIYFRYLGYIHCVKENVLEKLSSILDDENTYVYYDTRCDLQLW
jgi:hypothetical protein